MRLSQRDRRIVTIGAALSAVVLVVVYGVVPLIEYAVDLPEERQRLSARLQRMVETIQLRDHYQQELVGARDTVDGLRGRLISETDSEAASAELHRIINTTAESQAVVVRTITPEKKPERFDVESVKKNPKLAQFLKVKVTAQLQCRPDQLAAFLLELERNPRYVEVERIDINAWNVRADKVISPSVTLATYVLQPPAPEAETKRPAPAGAEPPPEALP